MARGEKSKVSKTSKERKKGTTVFPKYSLMEALRIAESVRDNNAGQPYNRIDLAKALNTTPESSGFRMLISASGRFGITQGGYQAEKIALTDLGRKITSPTSDEERTNGLLEALFKVEFYKKFFEKFRNNKLPRKDLLLNALEREFGISFDERERCYDLLIKNANELSLLTNVGDSPYVRFDMESVGKEGTTPAPDEAIIEKKEPADNVSTTFPQEPSGGKILPREPSDVSAAHKPIVFISHSKNITILAQIKSNLEFGGFKYKVAVETETTAIPIPEKVFGMMRECNCAIINISADEQEKREDGTYGINSNVLIEIGAAFLTYNKRVILVVDKRVHRPSNLGDLYRCEYEGDKLDSEAVTKLQKSLLNFRVPVD